MSTLSRITATTFTRWIARNRAYVTLTVTTVSGWATALSQPGGCAYIASQAEWLIPTAAGLVGTWIGWIARTVDAVRAGEPIPDVNDTTEWAEPPKGA